MDAGESAPRHSGRAVVEETIVLLRVSTRRGSWRSLIAYTRLSIEQKTRMTIATMHVERCTVFTHIGDVGWSTLRAVSDAWVLLILVTHDVNAAAFGANSFYVHPRSPN